jgi:hypothetical protein
MIDPTAREDAIADEVRQWYDANRETWWQRHAPAVFLGRTYVDGCADNFVLALIKIVRQADNNSRV